MLLATLLPFLILAWFNWPSSDDYFDWMYVQENGIPSALKNYYLHWGGRFSSSFIVYLLNPLQWGENSAMRWLTFIQLGLFVLLCYQLSSLVLNKNQTGKTSFSLLVLLSLFWWCYLPRPVELLFWFTGSMTYLPGLVAMGYWYSLSQKINPLSRVQKILLIILPFLIAGSNELNIFLMSCLMVWVISKSGIKRKEIVFALIFFVLGIGLALLAPGNSARSEFFSESAGLPVHDLEFTWKQSAELAMHAIGNLFFKTPILLLGLFLGFLPSVNQKSKKENSALFIAVFIIPIILYSPFCFGTGQMQAPDRVHNVVFIIESFLFLCFCRGLVNTKVAINYSKEMAIILGLICLFIPGNRVQSAWRDLGRVEEYQKQQVSRRKYIEEVKLKYDPLMITFSEIQCIPYTLFYGDLSSNPQDHFNQGFARYHGIRAVKVEVYEEAPK